MRTRDGMRIVAAEYGNQQAGQGNWSAWWCDDSGRWDVGAPWVVGVGEMMKPSGAAVLDAVVGWAREGKVT